MQPILEDLPNFNNVIEDYDVVDCTIRNPDCFYFLARAQEPDSMTGDNSYLFNDAEIPYRLIGYMRTEPEDEQFYIASKDILGHVFPKIEMTYMPLEQVIFYDGSEHGFNNGSGHAGDEDTLDLIGSIKAKCISDKIYVAQNKRAVRYRSSEGIWHKIGKNDISFEYDLSDFSQFEKGFYDVDGFDENNIYAVGGDGDVWRCIDNEWIQCGFPTNLSLDVVCCAGDGKVYISGTEGITYVGIEDSWDRVKGDTVSLPFKDIVWHEDRVWCSNDYGLWWIKDGLLEAADVPLEVIGCSRSLSARFGKLLVAGFGGAALHENGEWTLLF